MACFKPVGNKSEVRVVPPDYGKKLAEANGSNYVETSVRLNTNIAEVIDAVILSVLLFVRLTRIREYHKFKQNINWHLHRSCHHVNFFT